MSQGVTRVSKRALVITIAVIALLVAMFFGTTIQTQAEAHQAKEQADSPAKFAQKHYASEIVPAIKKRATKLTKVSKALQDDPKTAAKKYGVVEGSSAPVYSVTVTGTAKKSDTGMRIKTKGLPDGVKAYVQMGPAINGTAIRDASGKVHFPQFKNQIVYQNVGAALNKQVKKHVLSDVNEKAMDGKKVTITGAFQYVNPDALMIVPVAIEVGT